MGSPLVVGRSFLLFLLSCVWLLTACSNDPASTGAAPVPAGTWGGQSEELHVTAAGATLEDVGDCYEARIPGPLFLDQAGRFSANGTWVNFPLGTHPGVESPGQFVGTVSGDTMTLIATVNGYPRTYVLRLGSPPTGPASNC